MEVVQICPMLREFWNISTLLGKFSVYHAIFMDQDNHIATFDSFIMFDYSVNVNFLKSTLFSSLLTKFPLQESKFIQGILHGSKGEATYDFAHDR